MSRSQKMLERVNRANIRAPIPQGQMSAAIQKLGDRITALEGGGVPQSGDPSADLQEQMNELLGMLASIDERLGIVEAAQAKPKPKPKRAKVKPPEVAATDETASPES